MQAAVAMPMHHRLSLGLLLLAAVWVATASAARSAGPSRTRISCEVGQPRSGCRILAGQCDCGYGCRSDYPYSDREECANIIMAQRQQRRNLCGETPCQHGGACSQTTMEPGFRCRCEGTGFHGPRCQYACPRPGSVAAGARTFPHECILI